MCKSSLSPFILKNTFLGIKVVSFTGAPFYTKNNCEEAMEIINKNLRKGRPVMVGVDYGPGKAGDNQNTKTDHFVTIVGRGEDENGQYFSYYDNYTGKENAKKHLESIGRDTSKNKFRFNGKDKNGDCIVSDEDGNVPLTGNKPNKGYSYRITEVRDNE